MNRTPEITKEQFTMLQRIENGDHIYRDDAGVVSGLINYRSYGEWDILRLDTTMKLAMDLYETRLLLKRLLHD